MIIIIILFSY